jgi:hypothetical protein
MGMNVWKGKGLFIHSTKHLVIRPLQAVPPIGFRGPVAMEISGAPLTKKNIH